MPFADRWKSESLAETGQDPFWVLFIAWKVSKEVGGSFPVHEKAVWPSKNEEYEEGEEYQPTENSRLNVCVWEDSVEASHCWERMFVKWLTLEERLLAKDMEDAGCLLMGKGCRKDGTLSPWQKTGSICIWYFSSYFFPCPCGMENLF